MTDQNFHALENAPAPPPKKQHPPHWIRHLIRQIIGWALIVIGIIDLPLPGPGWLIIGLGAIVLAPYVKIFHRFVEWLKRKFPQLREPLDRFERRHFPPHEDPPPEKPRT